MDAAALVASIYGRILRTSAAAAGAHFEGLSQTSKCQQLELRLRLRRRLPQLDGAHAIMRQIIDALCDACVKEFSSRVQPHSVAGVTSSLSGDYIYAASRHPHSLRHSHPRDS